MKTPQEFYYLAIGTEKWGALQMEGEAFPSKADLFLMLTNYFVSSRPDVTDIEIIKVSFEVIARDVTEDILTEYLREFRFGANSVPDVTLPSGFNARDFAAELDEDGESEDRMAADHIRQESDPYKFI